MERPPRDPELDETPGRYTIILSADQEIALAMLTDEAGLPGITPRLMLQKIIADTLRTAEVRIEQQRQALAREAHRLPRAVRQAMLEGLTVEQQQKLSFLFDVSE